MKFNGLNLIKRSQCDPGTFGKGQNVLKLNPVLRLVQFILLLRSKKIPPT